MIEQVEKVTLWHKLAEHDLFKMFKEMHYNEDKFVAFQKKRMVKSLLVLAFSGIIAMMQPFFLLGVVVLAIYMYWASYRKVKSAIVTFSLRNKWHLRNFQEC